MKLENPVTVKLVAAWERLRWDVHELVVPLALNTLLAAFVAPRLDGVPGVGWPAGFYVAWFLWNLATVRLRVVCTFTMQLLGASVYFVLLAGWVGTGLAVWLG